MSNRDGGGSVSIGGNWDKRFERSETTGSSTRIEKLGSIDRRAFVKLSGLSAAAMVFGAGPFTDKALAQSAVPDGAFSLGVASGDPDSKGMVLWTRLAPDPLNGGGMPNRRVAVRWEMSEDENFRRIVKRGTEQARPELAHSVHAEVNGLRPGREYFYRFRVGNETSQIGRTKTTPEIGPPRGPGRGPGSGRPGRLGSGSATELKFAFASCQQYEHGFFTAFRRMSEEDLDLVVHLGDYIYEYGPNEYVAPGGNVRAHSGPEIVSIADYRNRHAQYRTDEDLQAAHAAFPWLVTWDDHEVDNNYADEIPEDRNAAEGNATTESFLQRRAVAYQAYYEHMPLRRSSMPKGPDMRLFRRINYGNLVEFNVMDTRQYRDDQAAGDGTKPPNPEQADPSRTLTGDEQEKWLLDGLRRSKSTWNVLAQQVFFAQRDFQVGAGERFSMDSWDGYLGSRERILEYINQADVRNPVVLTGDVHNNWANDIKADFDNENSETLGVEFVGTSITSGGDGADTSPTNEAVVRENPHIKFFNGQRGYVRCTVTPDEWRADYRILPFVKEPGAPVYTRASFVVENGNPGLQVADQNNVPTQSSRLVESDSARIRAQENAGE